MEEDRRIALNRRLKRVEGQVRALQTLVLESEDCEKVAMQLAAARKALDRVFFESIACMLERELDGAAAPVERYTRLLAKYG